MARESNFPFLRVAATCVILILIAIFGWSSCQLVNVGNVGIRVTRAGANRGVQDLPIVSGWVAYNPFSETIVEFPTTVQTVTWSQSPHEGQGHDESITFSSSDGITVSADVALSYHVDASHAGRLYTRFRETDMTHLTHGYVRNAVRDALNEQASQMVIHDIYGAGKTRLLEATIRQVRDRMGQDGFVVDQLSFQGALRLPPNVVDAINRAMQASQDAVAAQNRVAQIEAEARQGVARVQGEATAAQTRAVGEAQALHTRTEAEAAAIIARAEAEARARHLRAAAEADAWRLEAQGTADAADLVRPRLSPDLIRYWTAMRWDGHTPHVTGGATPLVSLPSP